MFQGNNGKILRVNLSRGDISVDSPDTSFYRNYLGGRGFISYFLLKELKGGEDPLGPENKLIFATGPVNSAAVPGAGRNSVGAKSPLTGGYGDAEAGGYWGAELKRAGYDAIIIEGKSPRPVYLRVQDGEVEIKDAAHLWGKTTGECQQQIQSELGDSLIRVAQIGPAGENLVRYASVVNDLAHVAGRCGTGAVMGSKNLRAIAVRGHGRPELADPELVNTLAKWVKDTYKQTKWTVQLSEKGTASVVNNLSRDGGLPTRNFQEGSFGGAANISWDALSQIMVGRGGCYACPVHCKPRVAVGEPYNVQPVYGGPEYETIGSLGSNCGVDDIRAVAKGHQFCNSYGLDSIGTGDNIAFAMECFEKGVLDKKAYNFEVTFGDAWGMLNLIEMITRREGLGDVLAEGVARAAKKIGNGAEQFAMHVKGQELPLHEPRYKPGMGTGYAVSPTGADHSHNMHDAMFTSVPFLGRAAELASLGIFEPLPCQELSPAKVRMLVYMSHWRHLSNSLVFCYFIPFSPAQLAQLITGITGWDTSVLEMMKVGERAGCLMRAFNIREGITSADDRLPERFFKPLAGGPLAGKSVDRDEFQQAVRTFYGMVGWDEDGIPTLPRLQELGIEWADEVVRRFRKRR